MRVLIVGTAFPLRGGIAHYVSLLYRSLEKRGHWVHILSFTRQYPKLLFPGKSQAEASETIIPLESDAVIDSINPITWFRAGKRAAAYEPDVLIFKYWLPFFAPAFGVIARVAKKRMKRKGKKCTVVFIADNVIPHEKRLGDIALTRFAFRAVDSFIVQSDAVERDLKTIAPTASYKRLEHPIYEIFGERVARTDARRSLGIPPDAPVILFFGYIRKYKGLDILLRAMPVILQALPKLHLIVAGEYYSNEAEYHELLTELQLPPENLILATDYIPNESVTTYFSAANAVVLPYRNATQSGIVQIAYNFDVPVIATDVGGLAEVVKDNETGLIVPEPTPAAVAAAVLHFFSDNLEAKLTNGVQEIKKKFTWEAFVEGVEAIVNNQPT